LMQHTLLAVGAVRRRARAAREPDRAR